MDSLTKLAVHHGTDKWGSHFYTEIYDRHLRHLRDRPVKLLEIGVGGYWSRHEGGESLRLWESYFPNGTIVGIDIFDKTGIESGRVKFVQGSQTDPAFLQTLSAEHGPFDVVIDDGSHLPDDVHISFETLFPLMKSGAIYIVEDVQTSYWRDTHGGSADLHDPGTMIGRLKSLVDKLNHAEIARVDPGYVVDELARTMFSVSFYHNLAVIEKGDNSDPSNFLQTGSTPRLEKALRTLNKAARKFPENPEIHYNRVRVLEQIGRMAEAIVAMDRTIEIEPHSPRRRGQSGALLMRAGQWQRAAGRFREAMDLSDGDEYYATQEAEAQRRAEETA